MDILTIILLLLVAYGSGVITHWIATRKQRRLLKHYQRRERTLRRIIPMEETRGNRQTESYGGNHDHH